MNLLPNLIARTVRLWYAKCMGRKGFSLPLIIILIIVAVLGSSILFLVKFKPADTKPIQDNRNIDIKLPKATPQTTVPSTKSPSPKQSPDLGYSEDSEMQGWKIYKNDKHNISFQYPEDWIFNVSDSSSFLDIHLKNIESNQDLTKCTPGIAAIEIQAGHKKNSDESFDTFMTNKVKPEGKPYQPGGELEKLTINGHLAYKVEHSGGATVCKSPGYFIEQNDSKYTHILTGFDEQNGELVEEDIFNKIVNSINYL